MAVGTSLGGLLAHRVGRRQVFALTLLVYGLATGASALVGGVALLLTLPARVSRTINLAVATLQIPFAMYNAAGTTWSYSYFYGLSIGLEVLLLAFILRSAWTWPRRTASPATLAASRDSEPLRTPQQA